MTAVLSFGPARPLARGSVGEDARYSDRARSAAATFAIVKPHLSCLGITRVAKQTALDNIGIPVYSALRPNGRTLASSQGKGLDDDSARISAAMEAIEFAFAEKPSVPVVETTIRDADAGGEDVFDAGRFLPIGAPVDRDRPVRFVHGERLSGERVLVPYDLIDIDDCDAEIASLSRSSNGLASGNTREEATLHGLLELIERDATALARLDKSAGGFGRPVAVESLEDPVVAGLVAMIERAGYQHWLFDQTSDIGIPVFQSVIGDPVQGYWRHFDLATGYGCHPNAARAAIRAITEAAQTRVTNIAGARDDFRPAEYRQDAHRTLVAALERDAPFAPPPRGMPLGVPTSALMRAVRRALEIAGCGVPTVVALGGEEMGISVVRVLSADLEDRTTNRNWRPGTRALGVMMKQ